MASEKANSTTKLYNRIGVLRAERALSRADLANAIGVNYQTVGYMERGDFNPSLEVTFRISEFFGLPIEAIFARAPMQPLSSQIYAPGPELPGKEKL